MEDSTAPLVNVGASVWLTISVFRTVLADRLVFGERVVSSDLFIAAVVAVFANVRLSFTMAIDVVSVLLGRTVLEDIPLASDGLFIPGLLIVADACSTTTTVTLYYLDL